MITSYIGIELAYKFKSVCRTLEDISLHKFIFLVTSS